MECYCILCNSELGAKEVSKVTPKGLQTLISASIACKDTLTEQLKKASSLVSHTECRKQYARQSSIKAQQRRHQSPQSTLETPPTLRSAEHKFDFRHDCIFSAEDATVNIKLPVKRRKSVVEVETL